MVNLVAASAKRWIRGRYGLWLALEWRNLLTMGAALPRLEAFEDREVERLTKLLGDKPSATVACVMPTYKRPEQLATAVESVLAQDYKDFVLVVVDDGGGLPDLPSDPRLRAVSLSRNTAVLGLVRNVGIRLTSSKYLAFLDDDNTWTPNHLSITTAALDGGLDFVYTAIRRRLADGEEFDIISRPFEHRTFADETNYVDSNSIVLRRSAKALFSRLPRKRDTQPKEDWEFVYRQIKNARVEHLAVPTVEYLINYNSYYTEWILTSPAEASQSRVSA